LGARSSAIVVNASFVILLVLFIVGPPVGVMPAGLRQPSRMSFTLLLSQFHLYVLVFLILLAWRRWADGSRKFYQIAAVRLLRGVQNGLVSSPRAVYFLTVTCALIMLAVSARRHFTFESRGDLALYDHGLWNTVHGVFHRSSLINDASLFAVHFEPLQLALIPLYFIAPSALTLLAVQAATIALGAVPLYWIARRHLANHPALWPIFPVAYLAFVPLRVANRFDYHPGALVPTLFLFALYFMERHRWAIMVLFLAMAGLLKENMPAAGVTIGLYLAVVARRRALGTAIALTFALWFYAGFAWIIPAFNPEGYGFFVNYAPMGNSISDLLIAPLVAPDRVIGSLLTRAGWKLGYVLGIFGPLAFLPLLSPEALFVGLPFLAQHLLATTRSQVSLLTHNSAEVVAFVFFGAVVGAARLVAWLPRMRWATRLGVSSPGRASMLVVVVLWSTTFVFHQWSELSYLRRYPSTVRARALSAALELIPPDATVAASNRVLPQLTHRRQLYYFPPQEYWVHWFGPAPGSSSRDADFVIVDGARIEWSHRVALHAALAEVRGKGYRQDFERDGIGVWRRASEHPPRPTQ